MWGSAVKCVLSAIMGTLLVVCPLTLTAAGTHSYTPPPPLPQTHLFPAPAVTALAMRIQILPSLVTPPQGSVSVALATPRGTTVRVASQRTLALQSIKTVPVRLFTL